LEPHPFARRIGRRELLSRLGVLGAAAAVAPPLLGRGLTLPSGASLLSAGTTASALPVVGDVVIDTFSGVAAFVVPGDDDYSRQQGSATAAPGGVAAGTPGFLGATLDDFLPAPGAVSILLNALQTRLAAVPLPGTNAADWLRGLLATNGAVPLGPLVAGLLDMLAVEVDPTSVVGPFLTPFPRLRWADKAQVWEQLELTLPNLLTPGLVGSLLSPLGLDLALASTLPGVVRFASGALLELTAFGSYSEYAVFDPATRTLTGRPVGWDLAQYQPAGRVDGWDEFLGYYQGRSSASA